MSVTSIRRPEPITQEELEHYFLLRNRALKLARKRAGFLQRLLERALAGANVEDGVHEAEIVEHCANGRIEKRLVVR